MAAAVYEHLRGFLPGMDENHCQRVEYLQVEVMRLTCEKLRADPVLKAKVLQGLPGKPGGDAGKTPFQTACAWPYTERQRAPTVAWM